MTHEELVEAVARKICGEYWGDAYTHFWDQASALDKALYYQTARAVIALIAEQTKEATPAMIEYFIKTGRSHVDPTATEEDVILFGWSAMQAKSALYPEDK